MPKLSVTTLILFIFLRLPRLTLVVATIILLLIPLLLVWGLVWRWNNVDKRGLLIIVQNSFRPSETHLYLAALIVLSGLIFFVFKKNQQFWYGLLETIVALTGCVVTAQTVRSGVYQSNSPNSILIQSFGAVYLLVRGLSNMDDGFKKSFWLKDDYDKFMYAYRYYVKHEKLYLQAHRDGKLFDKEGRLIRQHESMNLDD